MQLPGLIDPHVHIREPGATHKEDWDSGTAAAIAGGFTTILAMPNTQPPITDASSLFSVLESASKKARCDYSQFVGAGPTNAKSLPRLAERSAGLKMYLDQTYGPLRLDNLEIWMAHIAHWPKGAPLAAHSEGRNLAAIILLAALYDHPLHLCHVSLREEILVIRAAKEKGLKITCEVTPHHLFLTEEDIDTIGVGRSEVRPRLASLRDQKALWDNLDIVDCFATDHAPHTLPEKDRPNPPPGFPGLETSLPLFLTAVNEGRLTIEDLISRMYTNPKRIFHLKEQPETWIDVDLRDSYEINSKSMYSRSKWTPFDGKKVRGRLGSVYIRGKLAYQDGKVLAPPGSGKDVRSV